MKLIIFSVIFITGCTSLTCEPVIIDYELNEPYVYDMIDRIFDGHSDRYHTYSSPAYLFETFVPGVDCKYWSLLIP